MSVSFDRLLLQVADKSVTETGTQEVGDRPTEFHDVLLFLLLVRAVLFRRRFGSVRAFRVVTASNQ